MDHVGLAGAAFLPPVAFGGEAVGPFERAQIFLGTRLADEVLEIAIQVFNRISNGQNGVHAGPTSESGGMNFWF